VTPTPTPQAKTLKIGILMPLSGLAASWGTQFERGLKWGAEKVNAAGGVKVGKDIYMLTTVSCDNKGISSEAASCATKFVYEEGIHYVYILSGVAAVGPIFTQGKCFYISGGIEYVQGPDLPYLIAGSSSGTAKGGWSDMYLKQAAKQHPDVKTTAFLVPLSPTSLNEEAVNRKIAEDLGLTVVAYEYHDPAATDYYPLLTKIVAKNPDSICLLGNTGQVGLQTKQARELGYKGWLWHFYMVTIYALKQISGAENIWKIGSNEPDWTSPVYPPRVHELWQEYQRRWPGQAMERCCAMGFSGIMMYQKVFEQAGSIDPDEVMKVLDDPNFRFDTFFADDMALGGMETFGIRRQWQLPCDYGVITDLNHYQLSISMELTYAP